MMFCPSLPINFLSVSNPISVLLLSMVHGMEFIAQKNSLILYGFPLNYVCCTLYRKKLKLVQDIDTINDVSTRSIFVSLSNSGKVLTLRSNRIHLHVSTHPIWRYTFLVPDTSQALSVGACNIQWLEPFTSSKS